MYGWGFERMLRCGTMFLIAMVLMARASNLTTFCPIVEDLILPQDENDWDPDGYPKWIDIGLQNWKWRSKKNNGKRHSIKAHRNYVDSIFLLLFTISTRSRVLIIAISVRVFGLPSSLLLLVFRAFWEVVIIQYIFLTQIHD